MPSLLLLLLTDAVLLVRVLRPWEQQQQALEQVQVPQVLQVLEREQLSRALLLVQELLALLLLLLLKQLLALLQVWEQGPQALLQVQEASEQEQRAWELEQQEHG